MIEKTTGKYLEYLIHGYYDGLIRLKQKNNPSDAECEDLYALGYNQFTIGNYKAAKDIFILLTTIAPYTNHYWRAYGAVNQQMENYEEAIAGYDMALANDSRDIVSHVYRSECLIMSEKEKDAIKNLEEILTNPNLNTPSPWLDRAKLLLAAQQKKEVKK
ncbi:MAG: tetratricopeptide repeat protein [Candidatus Lokiarchaeota archaeon]|nr:tetratricopeptide repeat protein [Candidatus Lokiarchaeota archaeon]